MIFQIFPRQKAKNFWFLNPNNVYMVYVQRALHVNQPSGVPHVVFSCVNFLLSSMKCNFLRIA